MADSVGALTFDLGVDQRAINNLLKQFELLKGDPSVIKTATEELLRYTSPVETAPERYACEDVILRGVTIPKGELVLAVLASANRDEAQFACPDGLDLTRNPNRHLAFGQGVDYCLGAPLARLEGDDMVSNARKLRELLNRWVGA